MSLLEIVIYPDSRLRQVCNPVDDVNDDIGKLLEDMAETMYAAPGVGLAAPQVNRFERVIVVDAGVDGDGESGNRLYKLVNPTILDQRGQVSSEEGCLSIPGIRETIKRHEEVVVEALDQFGEQVRIEAAGFLAIVLQHEIDHLNGVLFIDHLSRLKRHLVKSKLSKLAEK